MKRVLLFVFGGLAALAAIGLVIGGVALLALFGRDGWFDSSRKRVATETYALVSEPAEIEAELPSGSAFDVRIRLRAESVAGSDDVFIGIAETVDVDRYLDGVAHEVVTDLDWGRSGVTTERVDGTAVPEPPAAQPFWVATTSGSDERTLDWPIETGSYRLVVMNADGSESVDVRARFGVRFPLAFGLGIGFLIAAAVLALVAIVLIVLAVRSRPRAVDTPPATPWGGSGAPAAPAGTPVGAADEPAAPSAAWRPPDQAP